MIIEAAADPQGSGTQLLIAALGAGGLGAIIAAIIAGIFSKKKLGAEATEIITKAAAGVVTNMEGDLVRMRTERSEERTEHETEMDELRRKMSKMAAEHVAKMAEMAHNHAAEREEWRAVLQLHVAWDVMAITKLAELDVTLDPAPPLLPPARGTMG
jgi:hypothetical protein